MTEKYDTNGYGFINIIDERGRFSRLLVHLTQDGGFQGDSHTYSYLKARDLLRDAGFKMGFENGELFKIYCKKHELQYRNRFNRDGLIRRFIQGYILDTNNLGLKDNL